jgi:hypothetical protein
VTTRRWLFLSLAGVALFLLLGRGISGLYAEWTWYAALGALPLYESRLAHEAALRLGAAAGGFLFAFANLYGVRRSIVSLVLPRRLGDLEIGEAVPGRLLTGIVLVLSIVIGLVLAVPQDDWTTLALARIGVPFNEIDPYLDNDFGYYVYRLPFERAAYLWALSAALLVTVVVVSLYALTPSLRLSRGRLYVSAYVRRHFAVLAALLVALVAWSYRIDTLSLLTHGSGADGAFVAFDHRVVLPLLTAMSLGALVASLVVLWAAWHGHHRVTLGIVAVLLLGGPGARAVLPLLAHWSTTEAESRLRDRPYLATRRLYTRRAFGVDEVVDADSVHASPMTRDAIARGVSSWDPAALLRSAEFERRGLASAALAWMPEGGVLGIAVVQHPTTGPGPWTLFGIDATSTDERGRVFERPPALDGPLPPVTVYEGADSHLVVSDSGGRIAAPAFVRWGERLAHAWHLQDPRLMLAEPPPVRPRILFDRDVRERISALAPFFTLGPTLSTVVRGDSLYWVGELFSTAYDYPLAEPQLFAGETRQYARHAATAFVQAHTGRVFLVADRRPDPVARSWIRRFPEIFTPGSALPTGLEAMRPPAVDWATVQGAALARTGFPDDTLVPAAVARVDDADADLVGAPAALFLTRGDDSPVAWASAIVDGSDRILGTLVARGGSIPRTEWRRHPMPVRWGEVLEQLQHAADSAGFGRQQRHGRRGRVQAIPGEDGPVFVQSFYEWPPDGPPVLAGVAVVERGTVRTGPSVADAFGRVHSGGSGMQGLRLRAAALYDAMGLALRRGDLRAFGDAYAALGRLLRTPP